MTTQDESLMFVAPSMQTESEYHVLDACVAPGGKTIHIASSLGPLYGGGMIALGIHEHEVKLIEENTIRLGASSAAYAQKMDTREVSKQSESEQFDRILVDVFCSNLGLLRRKSDIRYEKQPDELANLPKAQLEILKNCVPALKPFDILTYSTCTTLKEKNQNVVSAFLERHPDSERTDALTNPMLQPSVVKKMSALYSHQFYTDGSFICYLHRK